MKRTNEFKTQPQMIIPTVRVKPVAAQEPNIKAIAIKALVQTTIQGCRKER